MKNHSSEPSPDTRLTPRGKAVAIAASALALVGAGITVNAIANWVDDERLVHKLDAKCFEGTSAIDIADQVSEHNIQTANDGVYFDESTARSYAGEAGGHGSLRSVYFASDGSIIGAEPGGCPPR